jgi:hypothetical protein
MGDIRSAHSPNNRANPGYRRTKEVNDGPKHENMEGAVLLIEQNKNHAQDAVRDAQ